MQSPISQPELGICPGLVMGWVLPLLPGPPSSHTGPCIDPPLRSPAAYPLRASEHTTGTLTGAAKATRGRDTRSPRTWYEVRQI